jgi:ribosomal protein S18 acetylase RimI-like enzyme
MKTTAMKPLVRQATVDDAAAIAAVRMAGWRGGYAGIVPEAVLAGMSGTPDERLVRRIAEHARHQVYLVAELAGRIVGFVNAGAYRVQQHPDAHDPAAGAEIYAIYVNPQEWSGGAGSALMTEAIRRLRGAGLSPIRLWVLADNHRARRFYERHGFGPDGTVEPYVVSDGTVLDEVRYRLD